SLGPVKPASARLVGQAFIPMDGVVGEQNLPWISVARCDEDHSPSAVSESERSRINRPIGPPPVHLFETGGERFHCSPFPKLQHERDVLKHEPSGPGASRAQKPKYFPHEPR